MKIFQGILVLLTIVILQSCKTEPPTDLSAISIIPKPVLVKATGERYELLSNTKIYFLGGNSEAEHIANYLKSELSALTNCACEAAAIDKAPTDGIYLNPMGNQPELGQEGYSLDINPNRIEITANQPAGVFMGVQTLLQVVALSEKSESGALVIATGTITDYPRFSWRGSMLDVSRHFFGVDDVKRYIDLISYYKMNVLHLGLTNDQGWRIEIKSWPNLAIHGGSTQVGGGKGGYYTQDQYKEIVAYAQSKYITIVPEIDLPGHINAALASYGELNGGIKVPVEGVYKGPQQTEGIVDGKNKPTELYTGIEVGFSTLQYDKPATFRFVEDVLRELAAITPGPYLHIGGDEAHVTKKEDYIKFIDRFSEIVKANGKQMIGWEEIAQASIDANAIAQFWSSEEHAKTAAEKGAKIIMSPSKRVYLDMQYDSTTKLGLNWAAYIEVDDAYNWDPTTLVEGIESSQMLGVEAPLWSETIVTMDDIEYMVFPRLPGIAEVAWSPTEGKSWDEYKVRLAAHGPIMKAKGIDFYKSARVPWVE